MKIAIQNQSKNNSTIHSLPPGMGILANTHAKTHRDLLRVKDWHSNVSQVTGVAFDFVFFFSFCGEKRPKGLQNTNNKWIYKFLLDNKIRLSDSRPIHGNTHICTHRHSNKPPPVDIDIGAK